MARTDVVNRYKNLLSQIGRAGLHSAFPDDFEFYACSFELTDSKDQLIDSLVFPIMPESISTNKMFINNQKKTASGVVSMFDDSFVPFDINLSGNFGRKMRLLTSSGEVIFSALRNFTKKRSGEYKPRAFNVNVKTGYGAIKRLEKILNDSHSIDDSGNPVRLYFYNLSMNQQFLVECKNIRFDQNMQNNMIWNYNLTLKAIAPAFSVRGDENSSLVNILSSSVINSGFETISSSLKSFKDERINLIG